MNINKINCGILFNTKQNYFLPYLEWIINQQDNSNLFQISSIYTNGKMHCDKLTYATSLEEMIEGSDIVFSLGYWHIIPENLILRVPRGIVNIHHSYKLKYKGRHCSTWAIKCGEAVHGSTLHFIDKQLDEGKIIATEYFPIESTDTAEDIFFKANNLGLELLKINFSDLLLGKTMDYIAHDNKSLIFREKDLSHEISLKNFACGNYLLREVRSLMFDKKPAPYIVVDGNKIYLKLEAYDNGYLNKT